MNAQARHIDAEHARAFITTAGFADDRDRLVEAARERAHPPERKVDAVGIITGHRIGAVNLVLSIAGLLSCGKERAPNNASCIRLWHLRLDGQLILPLPRVHCSWRILQEPDLFL